MSDSVSSAQTFSIRREVENTCPGWRMNSSMSWYSLLFRRTSPPFARRRYRLQSSPTPPKLRTAGVQAPLRRTRARTLARNSLAAKGLGR